MSHYTVAQLLEIFSTGYGPRRVFAHELIDAADWLNNGVLVHRELPMVALPGSAQLELQERIVWVYGTESRLSLEERSDPQTALRFPVAPARGGLDHQILSMLACAWLWDRGFKPFTEVGWRDIFTECETWHIEVGTSRPYHLEQQLGRGCNRTFAIVPLFDIVEYQRPIQFDRLRLHVFGAGPKYTEKAFFKAQSIVMPHFPYTAA